MSFFAALFSALPSVSSSSPSTSAVGPFNASGNASVGCSSSCSGGPRIWPLSALMREEMKKGVAYNMKVVLRGMRGTGKTTLLSRLSGHPMPTVYAPSHEISATTIRICGRGCQPHEGTRIDVWDVVDEGRPRDGVDGSGGRSGKSPASLPPLPSGRDPAALRHQLALLGAVADARAIDVYRGCHMAIFLVDPSRPATLDYVAREAARVPPHTCVLLALNFTDRQPPQHGPWLSLADLAAVCRPLRRATTPFVTELLQGRSPPYACAAPAMWLALSAATGAGVPRLVDALNVPNTLLRVAALEETARGLYAQLTATAQRITDEADAEANGGRGRGDGGGTHHVITEVSNAPIASSSPSSSPPLLQPLRSPHLSHPTVDTAARTTDSRARNDGDRALKVAYAAPRTTTAPAATACDEHGIELGFFSDTEVNGGGAPEPPAYSSSSSSSEASAALSPLRSGPRAHTRSGTRSQRQTGIAPVSATTAPTAQPTAEAVPVQVAVPQEVPFPTLVVQTVEEDDALPDEAEVRAAATAAEAKAVAAAAELAEALRSDGGLTDDFFAATAAEPAAPAPEHAPAAYEDSESDDDSRGRDGRGAGERPFVARSLATQRCDGRPSGPGAGRAIHRRATAAGSSPGPTVNVDVAAMLAAMQATLEAAGGSAEVEGATTNETLLGAASHREASARQHRVHHREAWD